MTIRNVPGYKRLTEKNSSLAYLAIVIIIFGVGTLGSIVNWHNNANRTNAVLVEHYQRQLNQSKSIITNSLNQYSRLLDDGTSLLAASDGGITQAQWLTFFQSYGLTKNYPGVQDIGYSTYVPAASLPDFLNTLAAGGQPNVNIIPAGTRDTYVPVTYIAYISPLSRQATGYDQFSDSIRRTAITGALNTGNVTVTHKVTLASVGKNSPAFIAFKPVYNGPATTPAERQTAIRGFVFMAVNSAQFFNTLIGRYITPAIAIQIYNGSPTNENLLYQTNHFADSVKHMSQPINSLLHINFGGQTWSIKVVTASSVLHASASSSSNTDLVIGVALSAVVAFVLWYFTYYRERKIYWQKQQELQAAKDELLSLASHQLRTPASIVKQYLGILLQNYGGSITEQQRKILQTAYDSNERQLEIANQFLQAARLGSGRIELRTVPTDVSDLLEAVIAEQQKIASSRRQRIIFNRPKRAYRVLGDPKYLPMVFENLINNASKYSKRQTKITVSVRRVGDEIVVDVSDQGIGITAEELPTVFDKFTHAANEQRGSGNSTGIGLYLAQQIARLHGGSITVRSVLSKGSTFSVHLPPEPPA